MTESHLDRVARLKRELVTRAPFFGVLATHMGAKLAPHLPTMATDGVSLFVNPGFLDTLTDGEATGVIVHDVLHVALDHVSRGAGKCPDTWNKAADYAINPEVLAAGFALPKGALIDKRFAGLSADAIYSKLGAGRDRAPAPKPGNGAPQPGASGAGASAPGKPGNGPPKPGNGAGAGEHDARGDFAGPGGILPPPPGTSGEEIREDWRQRVKSAVAVCRRAGTLPGIVERLAEAAARQPVDWREVLRDMVADGGKNATSWTRPNRRFIGAGLYLPGRAPDSIRELAVCVDTSGSIGAAELNAFGAEIDAMLSEGVVTAVAVVYCDAAVNGTDRFEQGDVVKLRAIGGGGTDFRPALKWVSDNVPNPVAAVYLTDLYGPAGDDPGFPVIWCDVASGNAAMPAFGRRVIMH